jgi:hypothetical protein
LDALRRSVEVKARSEQPFLPRTKEQASLWLGLLTYERGNYPAAIDYFMARTLLAFPNGVFTHAARYNLGRSYEAAGQYQEAVNQYVAGTRSPAYHGNMLRARWLVELRPATGNAPPERPAPDTTVPEPAIEQPAPPIEEPEIKEPAVEAPPVTAPPSEQPAAEGPKPPAGDTGFAATDAKPPAEEPPPSSEG